MELFGTDQPDKTLPQWNHTNRGLWAPDLVSPSHTVPHTHEAGDSYYIGDVYEPSRIGQDGRLIDKNDSKLKSSTSYVSELAVARVEHSDLKQGFEALHEIPGVSCSRLATYFISCRLHESDHSST